MYVPAFGTERTGLSPRLKIVSKDTEEPISIPPGPLTLSLHIYRSQLHRSDKESLVMLEAACEMAVPKRRDVTVSSPPPASYT
jgi:hypothetical protein